jgi:hypothetical protein
MGAYETQKRSFAWKIPLVGTISVASWLVAITGRYFLWLEYYDYVGKKLLLISTFTLATISTAAWAVLLRRRDRGAGERVIYSAMVTLVTAIVLLPWNGIFARTWFAANHGKFATLADLARQRKLPADPSGWSHPQRSPA